MIERGQATELKTMRNKVTGALVSAKWVQRESGAALGKQTEREIINHRKLLHPHIIRLLEVRQHAGLQASGVAIDMRMHELHELTQESAL